MCVPRPDLLPPHIFTKCTLNHQRHNITTGAGFWSLLRYIVTFTALLNICRRTCTSVKDKATNSFWLGDSRGEFWDPVLVRADYTTFSSLHWPHFSSVFDACYQNIRRFLYTAVTSWFFPPSFILKLDIKSQIAAYRAHTSSSAQIQWVLF